MSDYTDALTAELSDDQIEAAIAQHDDPQHSESWTVPEVRDVLTALAESAHEVYGEWIDNIERGDATIVAQTDDLLVLDAGERNPLHDELDVIGEREIVTMDDDSREILSHIITHLMHEIAGQHSDRSWPATYPWVIPMPTSATDAEYLVQATVNSLISRGLTATEAWAYYGVEIRGESQSSWGRRQDRNQQQISKALKQARQKLP